MHVEREADLAGFLERLLAIPDDVIERKQRAIEESDAEGMEEPLISGKPKYASM